MKKIYCLVVTDDYNRFSWVFFLATKDETSEIIKTFITDIENLIDLKVKVIRCDNETKFKNKVMNQFCEMKGIKREFSIARTPQQNGVAERENRTLIEAARTMLDDSKLPTTFWAEAVNTACYVQNRVLVIQASNTRPLNELSRPDEGFLIGYSTNSKAFRVFNSALTNSMNYKPVVTGNQSNGNAGTKACNVADSKSSPDAGFKPSGEKEKKDAEDPGNKDSEVPSTEEPRVNQEKDDNVSSTNNVNTARINNTNTINNVSQTVNTAGIEVIVVDPKLSIELPDDLNMPELEDIVYLDDDEDSLVDLPNRERAIGTKWVYRNKKDERGIVIKNNARLVVQGYTQEEGIHYDEVFAPVARIKAIRLFLAYALFKDFVVYQMDVKSAFLYGKIEKEVFVYQPPGFEDPDFPDRVYKALYGLHQAPRAWYETLSTYLLDNGFQRER
ncbi:retrovirus-related pol polyprotein from transposon TNT 1-94 [Tanacetum coccineum]